MDLIKIRRDTAANWQTQNPTLGLGEIGIVATKNQASEWSIPAPMQFKVGNGRSNWNTLTMLSTATSGSVGESNVLVAEYGETSYDDLVAALYAGKAIVVLYHEETMSEDNIYMYSLDNYRYEEDTMYFTRTEISNPEGNIYSIYCSMNDGWGESAGSLLNIESANNKVTGSLSSSSTDTEYPSAKCVYDGLELKANRVDKVNVANSVASKELAPNTLYVFATRSNNLTLSFGTPVSGIENEYKFIITIDSTTLPTISGLSGITWYSSAPAFALGKRYEISIVDNYGVFLEK